MAWRTIGLGQPEQQAARRTQELLMRTHKRTATAALVGICIVALLSGCASTEPAPTGIAAQTPTAPTTDITEPPGWPPIEPGAEVAPKQVTPQAKPTASQPGAAPTSTAGQPGDMATTEAAPEPEAKNAATANAAPETETVSELVASVEQVRAECESRDGRTELLPDSFLLDAYSCYEITVLEDGWRTCVLSLPYLDVRAATPYEPEYPCGEPGPEWPFAIEEAPADCDSAADWYAVYLESFLGEMTRIVAQAGAPDAAAVQSWLSDLGHRFEQNSRRAQAAQASCAPGEMPGIYLAISEAQDGLDEVYDSVVVSCLADGIHDCTVLAPTLKARCESYPEFVYVLDEFTLADWPLTAGIGCTLLR